MPIKPVIIWPSSLTETTLSQKGSSEWDFHKEHKTEEIKKEYL